MNGRWWRSTAISGRQDGLLVADAALYTAENLKLLQGVKWISRVPLTLSEAQKVVRQVVPFAGWDGLAKDYRLIEVCNTYAEVAQRWVIVESEKRREADLKALQKRVKQEEQQWQAQLNKLSQESFACEADALKAMKKFEQTLHYYRLSQVSVVPQAHHGKRGRPKQNSQPQAHSYHQIATLVTNQETIEEQQLIAGRFILATNVLECEPLSGVEVFAEYKKQQSSERGFRFLKDPLFFTSSVFLKSQQRQYGFGNGHGTLFISLHPGSTQAPASPKCSSNRYPQSTGQVDRYTHDAMGVSVFSVHPFGDICRTQTN